MRLFLSLALALLARSVPTAPSLAAQLAPHCPNQPAGWTLWSDRHFTSDPAWASTGAFTLVRDSTAPDGDGWVGQEFYAAGKVGGSATMASWPVAAFPKGKRSVYICQAVKIEVGWVNNPAGSKETWVQIGPFAGHHENRIFTTINNGPQGATATSPLIAGVGIQGIPSLKSVTGYRDLALGIVPRGRWVWWELRVDMDAAGHGGVRLWLDGVAQTLRPSYSGPPAATDLQLTWPGEPVMIAGTKVNNTYGGSLEPVPKNQRIWLDAHATWVP